MYPTATEHCPVLMEGIGIVDLTVGNFSLDGAAGRSPMFLAD